MVDILNLVFSYIDRHLTWWVILWRPISGAFRIFGDGAMPSANALYRLIVVGPERTLQQYPLEGIVRP